MEEEGSEKEWREGEEKMEAGRRRKGREREENKWEVGWEKRDCEGWRIRRERKENKWRKEGKRYGGT